MSKKRLLAALPLAALLFLPAATQNPYLLHMAILSLLWVVLGQSWNLLGGYTGQISFGHAAFFGVGAYTTGILIKSGFSAPAAWWGLPLGGLAAAAVAALIGWICLRLRGSYFSLSVLALSEVLRLVAVNWKQLTNGAEGILLIPAFTGKIWYYYIVLALAALTFVVIGWVMGSKPGYYFLAIREDQDCAESLGIDTTKYKLLSVLLSAFFTGVAGGFYLNYIGFIDPGIVFSVEDISIMMILVTMLGGAATRWGPAVGAVIFILVSELLRVWVPRGHLIFFGVLMIGIIIFFPNGIVGAVQHARALRRRSRGGPATA
jgi:branched-chain amino acid transport system permease protein